MTAAMGSRSGQSAKSAGIAASSSASGAGGRPRRPIGCWAGDACLNEARCGRDKPKAEATALTGPPSATRSHTRATFWKRRPAQSPRAGSLSRASSCPGAAAARGSVVSAARSSEAGTTSPPAPAAVNAPRSISRSHVNSWLAFSPWRRAAGDERDGLAGQIGLFDEAHLLLGGRVPPALDGR